MSATLPELALPPASNGMGHASVHKMPSSSTMGMDDDDDRTFDSPEVEVVYYRERYRRILDALNETRAELDEFQTSSKELEDELEKELAVTEKQQGELKERIKRLEMEKDDLRAKHLALQKMHSSTTAAMQREMDNLRGERDNTLVAMRDLEMGNDDLERNERVAVSSLLDLESKYNRAIEEKTLLEQEVVQRQELEEECQRLKDDVRDANNEITMLKEQLTRTVPTPPSSVSVPMSPVQEASRELSMIDDGPVPAGAVTPTTRTFPFPRSATATSIPQLVSPSAKRYNHQLVNSPSGLPLLSRSTTTRNLASAAGTGSPAPRSRVGAASPARVSTAVSSNQAAKTKGFKLLHDLQARLKATDDKLNHKMPKRNVSAPMPLNTSRRGNPTPSTSTLPSRSAAHARVTALAKDSTPVPLADQSGSTLLSPNGWVLIDEGEDTPPNRTIGDVGLVEPPSPLENHFRPPSSNASRGLPSRPGIPSPLASISQMSRSTSSRPPTRTDPRPMSPSMLPQPTRSFLRPASPAFALSSSTSRKARIVSERPPSRATADRPPSRTQHHAIGRGPPPTSHTTHQHAISVSHSAAALKRSSRRSSLGTGDAHLPPTGIPTPSKRPISVPVFDSHTPPPVPRIPSAHLRKDSVKRQGMLGVSVNGRERERTKSGFS
ncbi:hypothetical protein P7C73_g4626, partial [Tremellales sp. Uapishka_1]